MEKHHNRWQIYLRFFVRSVSKQIILQKVTFGPFLGCLADRSKNKEAGKERPNRTAILQQEPKFVQLEAFSKSLEKKKQV